MKSLFIGAFLLLFVINMNAQKSSIMKNLKMNCGIITEKIAETKVFYTNNLNFGVSFENDFYLLLHTPNHSAEISFLLPNHPTQKSLFQPSFDGKGVYLTIEVDNVDEVYQTIKNKGIDIKIDLRDEPWGDRHFAIVDPNGVGIDIVTYSNPDK